MKSARDNIAAVACAIAFATSSTTLFAGIANLASLPDGGAVPKVSSSGNATVISGWRTAVTDDQSAKGSFTIELDAPTDSLCVVAYPGGAISARRDDGTWLPPVTAAKALQVWSPRMKTSAIRIERPCELDRKSLREQGAEKGAYAAQIEFIAILDFNAENLSADAGVAVSSADEPSSGFQPRPWVNKPETLISGEIDSGDNFRTAQREDDISADKPEWMMLAWDSPRSLCAIGTMRGRNEKGLGNAVVEVYAGDDEPRFAVGTDGWQPIDGEWRQVDGFRNFEIFAFPEPVTSRAVRLRCIGGARQISIGEIIAFGDAPSTEQESAQKKVAGVPITFSIPDDGKVTIQVRDSDGKVVANPIAGVEFTKGEHTVLWNLENWEGKPVLGTGEYSWRGIYTPPLKLTFKHTYHPWPLDGVAWQTPDRKGGWLADHEPPRTICRGIDGTMWIGAFAEAGDSIVHLHPNTSKIWGTNRCWVAIPSEICTDGDYYYGLCEGGWIGDNQVIIQIDQRTHADRKIFQRPIPKQGEAGDDPLLHRGISGFQVIGDRAYLAFANDNLIQVFDISKGLAAGFRGFGWDIAYKQFDDQKPVLVQEIRLPSPGRIRPYGEGRLVTTSGKDVVVIDAATGDVTPLFAGKLRNPLGLGTDAAGNIYVGEGEPLHQVFRFSPDGTLTSTLGKPGRRQTGPFDENDLEEPFGVEVAEDGTVWVMEHVDCVRRVSLWDADSGKCVKAVYGPTRYGGGGCIDPADDRRLFYKGLEFYRETPDAPVKLVNVLYRVDSEKCARFNDADYPGYAFRTKRGLFSRSKLWFTSYMAPHGHPSIVLWQYKGDHVQPVAAIGSAIALRETFGYPAGQKGDWKDWSDTGFLTNVVEGYQPDQKFFTWTDLDNDGFVQPGELKFGRLNAPNGRLLTHASAGWNWRMNHDFIAAANAGEGQMVFFKPSGFSSDGYPIYDVPTEVVPGSGEGLMTDSEGNAIVLGGPLTSVAQDGTVRWLYRNDWPGLHAGHHTTARGNEPGVLIAPTRVWGIEKVNDEIGEIVSFNSNLGCTYLMTTDDGLYIDRIFRDQRVGLLWNFTEPPASDVLAETSTYDEHFGGIFQKARGRDGRDHFYYIVGKNHCSIVEIEGLEKIKRLPGGKLEVSPDDIAAAQAVRLAAAQRKAEPKIYDVKRVADGAVTIDSNPADWEGMGDIDGFSLCYDSQNLYVLSKHRDDRAPFANNGANPLELFKSGDVLDIMLQTKPGLPENRSSAGEGDLRISLSVFQGEPLCVVYDFVVPGTSDADRIPFSSPWRTLWCDKAGVLTDAKIAVSRNGADVVVEAAIPLATIHFDPSSIGGTAGDVGRVYGDNSATQAARREYWSNKDTNILSDLPSEAGIVPCLWGRFNFK